MSSLELRDVNVRYGRREVVHAFTESVRSGEWLGLIGPDNRYLLPASALLGASMLLLADAVSRTIVAPAELPIGIVTAAVGAPFFLWILLRRRGILDL